MKYRHLGRADAPKAKATLVPAAFGETNDEGNIVFPVDTGRKDGRLLYVELSPGAAIAFGSALVQRGGNVQSAKIEQAELEVARLEDRIEQLNDEWREENELRD